MSEKPREFWIELWSLNDNDGDTEVKNVFVSKPKHWPKKPVIQYHVIEHSAYEELEKKFSAEKKMSEDNFQSYNREITALKASNDQFKSILDAQERVNEEMRLKMLSQVSELEAVKKERDELKNICSIIDKSSNETCICQLCNTHHKMLYNINNPQPAGVTHSEALSLDCARAASDGDTGKSVGRFQFRPSDFKEVYLNAKITQEITEKANAILSEKRDQLRSQLAVARGALEFYADKDTYGSDDKSRSSGNKCFDIVCFDFDRNLEPKKDFAGRKAREALKLLTDEEK